MAMFTNTVSRPVARKSGFALLAVISLLGLLVLLVVGLASFTRVETNIASASQSEAQARQNALTALNLAIGQLQRAAGPDQRVTATAANTFSNTNPLSNADYAKNPYWTGVWDTSAGAPVSFNNQFVQWLVNPANDAIAPRDLTNINEPNANKPTLTATTSGTTGDDGVINIVGVGRVGGSDSHFDGSVVANPPVGEPGNGVLAGSRAQFIDLELDNLQAAGLPGFGASDYRTFGRIAWWTSDDGVKASLSGVPLVDQVNYNLGAPAAGIFRDDYRDVTAGGRERRERLTSLTLQGTRTDLALRNLIASPDPLVSALNPGIYGAMGANATWPYIARVDSLRQFTGAVRAVGADNLPFGVGFFGVDGPSLSRNDYTRLDERIRERFHDIAPATFSVLSDTANGGLKMDFDAFTSVTLPANYSEVGRYRVARVSPRAANLTQEDNILSTIALADLVAPPSSVFATPVAPLDEPVAVIGPVISECEVIFNWSRTATGALEVTISGQVELWNPYNAVMENPNSATDRWLLRVLAVDVISTEQFSDVLLSDGVKTTAEAMSMARTLGLVGPIGPYAPEFVLSAPLPIPADIPPGRARTWSFTSAAVPARNGAAAAMVGFDTTGASNITAELQQASTLTVVLVREITGAGGSKTEFYSVAEVDYDVSAPTDTNGIRFHFRLSDAADKIAAPFWLEVYDPRGPRIYGDASANAIDRDADPIASFTGGGGFDTAGLIRDVTAGAASVPLILFDVPRQNITSVGYLAQMPHMPPNLTSNVGVSRIGTAGATPYNEVFDTHYFSSIPGRAAGWDPQASVALPNTSLVVVNRPPAGTPPATPSVTLADFQIPPSPGAGVQTNAAQYFLVRDTLNVNSVSETAWRSVLGGMLPGLKDRVWIDSAATGDIDETRLAGQWDYIDGAGNIVTATVSNAFFRMPMTAAALEDDYTTLKAALDAGTLSRNDSYRLGIRELTNLQVDALSRQVVTRIMARTAPFGSVQAFVDSNILQQSIDAVPTINAGLETFAPAFLTQADILQAIGHRLVARSDTFTIRTYGESTNPALDPTDVNFVRGRAWLEAVVQRMPMAHPISSNPNNDMLDTGSTTGTHLGRQFRVVSLRWLTPNDL